MKGKKELEDAIIYIEMQKEEIARQIIRVKYAKKRGVLLFLIGLVGGILGVYLMSLIF